MSSRPANPMDLDVPFTVDADLDLGRSTQPWLRSTGADVYIRRGAVPTALRGVEARRNNWECAGERVLIHSGRMRFLVDGGRSIHYAAAPNTDPLDLRFFLLGTPWLALAAQRGLLPLHASAVAQGQSQSGPVSYDVELENGKIVKRHIDHLRDRSVLTKPSTPVDS